MKSVILTAIRFYQRWLSPIMPGACRFAPSCSEYARQAVERRGIRVGTLLTSRRLLKCHPFNPGGYDPVPEKTDDSKIQNPNSKKDLDLIWNLESGIWNSREENLTAQRNEHHG